MKKAFFLLLLVGSLLLVGCGEKAGEARAPLTGNFQLAKVCADFHVIRSGNFVPTNPYTGVSAEVNYYGIASALADLTSNDFSYVCEKVLLEADICPDGHPLRMTGMRFLDWYYCQGDIGANGCPASHVYSYDSVEGVSSCRVTPKCNKPVPIASPALANQPFYLCP
ncbi:TPA: hypothetical protein HA265_06740 [Candidatus Woesearchaeota archaeon]|nr:hypothetical protein [Candidatus Woesearchaeota archaeon]